MSLKDWLENGWLTKHETSEEEIRNLLGVADRDLCDCQSPGLSADWQMNIAYNAALQAATAALAVCGYRASRDSHHYRIIQSLAYTIAVRKELIAQLDQFRKKRNIGGYERAGLVSDAEAAEMIVLAQKLRNEVEKRIQTRYPKFL
ncbi:MAG TPA: hypothetical protein VMW24_15985 [Sedimentisphaerales bacterium]|nr:hypothetical protein [Sedimentisphaerales bacterium]